MLHPPHLNSFLEAQLPTALDWLRQMVGINSFTLNRAGVKRLGELTAGCFAPLGFRAEFVPAADARFGDHLVLTRPGSGARSIALVSHLDTVFPPEEEARNQFHWQAEGDRIFGPVPNDIKGGTMVMWLVLQALAALARRSSRPQPGSCGSTRRRKCFRPISANCAAHAAIRRRLPRWSLNRKAGWVRNT